MRQAILSLNAIDPATNEEMGAILPADCDRRIAREEDSPDVALDVDRVISKLSPHLRPVAFALLRREGPAVDAVCQTLNCTPQYARRQIARLRQACIELGLGAYGR